MLEAFYDKTYLAKYFGNCLEMHFEYSHLSVAQKLTELRIFVCEGYSRVNLGKLYEHLRRDCRNSMLEAFYDKTCLAKCFGNCLEMHFEYSHVFVAQKLTELQIFGCQGYSRVKPGKL